MTTTHLFCCSSASSSQAGPLLVEAALGNTDFSQLAPVLLDTIGAGLMPGAMLGAEAAAPMAAGGTAGLVRRSNVDVFCAAKRWSYGPHKKHATCLPLHQRQRFTALHWRLWHAQSPLTSDRQRCNRCLTAAVTSWSDHAALLTFMWQLVSSAARYPCCRANGHSCSGGPRTNTLGGSSTEGEAEAGCGLQDPGAMVQGAWMSTHHQSQACRYRQL